MNAINALIFAVLGSAMEILPRAFPSLFPHYGSDQSSARALWLAVMGAVQITLGVGIVLTSHLFPAVTRLFAVAPSREPGRIALPEVRVTVR
jgi:hypothetical protein